MEFITFDCTTNGDKIRYTFYIKRNAKSERAKGKYKESKEKHLGITIIGLEMGASISSLSLAMGRKLFAHWLYSQVRAVCLWPR